MPSCRLMEGTDRFTALCVMGELFQFSLHSKYYERRKTEMKKYEAPVVEVEVFAVENVMDGYEAGTNDLPIF